jgi:hypothetical protein
VLASRTVGGGRPAVVGLRPGGHRRLAAPGRGTGAVWRPEPGRPLPGRSRQGAAHLTARKKTRPSRLSSWLGAPPRGGPPRTPSRQPTSWSPPVSRGPSCPGPATAPAGSTTVCWALQSHLPGAGDALDPRRHLPGDPVRPPHSSRGVHPVPGLPGHQLVARRAAGGVRLTWCPAASPEPDLVGYQVGRNGRVVDTCSTNGPKCPAPLGFFDQPSAGTWTYAVVALRFGPDAAPADAWPPARPRPPPPSRPPWPR